MKKFLIVILMFVAGLSHAQITTTYQSTVVVKKPNLVSAVGDIVTNTLGLVNNVVCSLNPYQSGVVVQQTVTQPVITQPIIQQRVIQQPVVIQRPVYTYPVVTQPIVQQVVVPQPRVVYIPVW